jgi:hypothetical protein
MIFRDAVACGHTGVVTDEKVDFRKTLDAYRAKPDEFRIVDVPPLQYLMVDGHGDPNDSDDFRDATAALYPLAYTIKFASKRELGRDYVVMPLEGLWWSYDMAHFTSARDKSTWDWTLLMMTPEWITRELFDAAVAKASAAHPSARLDRMRLETLAEGLCVQTLHIGSYDDEAEVLARMHDRFIPGAGLTMTGLHHEVYLSDARRVEPARRRTILRQPVAATGEPRPSSGDRR